MIWVPEKLTAMREDTFLGTDAIAPFENRKIELTEMEKEEVRKEMLDALNGGKKLPE